MPVLNVDNEIVTKLTRRELQQLTIRMARGSTRAFNVYRDSDRAAKQSLEIAGELAAMNRYYRNALS